LGDADHVPNDRYLFIVFQSPIQDKELAELGQLALDAGVEALGAGAALGAGVPPRRPQPALGVTVPLENRFAD